MEISRRGLLSAASLGVLAACAPAARTSARSRAPAAPPTVATSTTPGPATPPAGARWSHGGPLPTREEVVRAFAGRPAHQWGWHVEGVVNRLRGNSREVALTFDACGGPGGSRCDYELVALLRRHGVRATLLLNARWIAANSAFAGELAADPLFALANHGVHHRPLSVSGRSAYGIRGTRGVGEIYDEIEGAAAWFVDHTGARPRYFRPGTAHTDEIGSRIARALGEPVIGFAVNGDAGATLPAGAVAANLLSARPGDIVISHMNQPGRGTSAGYAAALPRMLDRGVRFTTLGPGAA